MIIKKEWAGKWEIDLISIKKIVVWVLIAVALFYTANVEIVDEVIGEYIDPKLISLIAMFVLFVREQLKHDYSK